MADDFIADHVQNTLLHTRTSSYKTTFLLDDQ